MNFPGFSPRDLTQRELFDSAVVALSMTRADTSFVAVNDAYARLFGYDSPRELMAEAPLATDLYVDSHDGGRVVAAVEKNGSVSDFEVRMRRRDGAVRWMSIGMSAIRDAEGALIAFHAALFDVTEPRAARERALVEERRLRIEHGVALRLQAAETAGAGLEAVIRHICETEGWLGGRYWRVDAAAGVARFGAAWGPAGSAIEKYNEESRAKVFHPGAGYVGRAWESAEPLWVADVQKDGRALRAVIGQDVPKRSTFLIPVVAQGSVIGVLAFDSAHVREADSRLLQAARIIGAQLGQFLRRKESEEAVRRSEALNRGILDASMDGIVTIDADGRLVEFNAAAERLSGWPRDEALGRDMAELIIPARLREQHRAGLQRLLRTGKSELLGRRIEVPALRRDGSTFDAELSIVRVPGPQPMFTGTLRDITARKREDALSRLQHEVTLRFAQARSVGDALQAAIRAICESEGWEAGRYLAVDGARGVLRDAAAWCIDVAPIRRYVEESSRREYAPGEGLVGHVWQTGEPLWVPDISVDPRVARPHLAAITGMHSSVVLPVHAEGQAIGVFIFDSREIRRPDELLLRTLGVIGGQVGLLIRRAQAEEAMRESEARFRSLTALSADWYWEQDAEFRLTFMSQEMSEKTGLPARPYIGQRRWDQPALNLDEEAWAAHRAQLERHEPFKDFEMQRPDGKGGSRWVSLTGEPVFDAEGRFTGYRGVGKDITARKRDQELLELEHAITRCLAEAESAHDALQAAMRKVCETRGWECGRYFRNDAGVFRFVEGWHVPGAELERFLAYSVRQSFPAGVGIVGRAGAGEPIWVENLAQDARVVSAPMIDEHGMRGAFMFPVVSGAEVLGVLSFTSRRIRQPDARMLEAVRVIGSQIGQFLRRKQAEAVLRDSEARFRGLVELSSDWYWEQDEEFRFTRFEGTVSEGSGNPSGALGKRRWEIPSITPLSATWREHRAVLAACKPFRDFEYSRLSDDGELRYVEVSGEPVFDADGLFRGYRGLAADITERKRAQAEREKIGRMYASLSALNELVARAKSASELLQGVCEIAVSSGDFQYALVRVADEARGVLDMVAFAGVDNALRIDRPLSLDPASPDAEALVIAAYRTGKPAMATGERLVGRPHFARLMAQNGTRSAGGYPLMRGGKCIGAIFLNSRDPHAFDGETGELLARMARSVSQGLDLLQAGDELRRFRRAVDQSAEMIALVDVETMRYLDVNEKMCEALGYRREELLGMHPYDLLPRISREALAESYRAIVAGTGTGSLVSEYRRKDGSAMQIESMSSVMESGGRHVIVAVARDIGERLAREEALRRLTRMYAALSSLNEIIPRIRDGRDLLQQACEIVGSSGDFLRAAVRLLDRATGSTRFVASSGVGVEGLAAMEISIAEQAAQGPSLVVEALRSGKPVIARDYLNDPRTQNARQKAAVRGARSAGAFPLLQGGESIGVLIIHGNEVTSFDGDMQPLLERMAQNLSFGLDNLEAESRFRQTFEASGSGIAHVGLDGRFLRVNPALCEMLGYPAAELVGRSVKDISHPDDRDASDRLRERLRRGDVESVRLEKRYLRKDGSVVWVALTIALARDAHGAPSYEISIYEDVTQRKRDERLLQLEHAVTRCLAEAETKSAGVQGLIRAVCEANGWPVGRYFVPDAAGEVLRFDEGWADADANAEQFLARSRSTTYAPGEGLSGWVWQKGEPLWVADVAQDARTTGNARPASFRRGGAMVFPVAAGGATLGVLSFSRPDPTPPDERLLKAMGIIASQLGQFLVKKRGEEERAAMRERDQSLVRALGEIIYDWRPLEDSLRWEGDYASILGYAQLGDDTESWTSRVHPEDMDAVMTEVTAASAQKRNYDLQYRFRRSDGRYLWMHHRGVCSFDEKGRLTRMIGVLANIDSRKRSEQALRGIVQASAEPLLLVRKDGTAQFVNPAAEALFGRSAAELEGAMLGLPLADGRPAEVDIVLPGGGVRPAEMQFAATELEGQELLVVSLHDLSERKRYESHIEHLANHDALTSLPNRTLLRDRVEQAIVHARRAGGHVGLMFVDLDQFKLVNDSWGHAIGDMLLLEVAQRLQRTVRDGDTVARLGGDEFVVLLPGLARADNTSVVARKVAEALEKVLVIDGREMRITASIGIALFPDDGADLDSLLQCADAAMYRAKDAGRNGYQYYSADMGTQARARVDTESGLRLALSRDELRLHYQPQVELQDGAVKGFEALMRWEHPSRGMISPMDFIPVAEESGLILPMGDWALVAACREARAWSAGGFGALKVAVNLSARQFWRGSVTEAVRKALGESGLPPSQLEIEITESVVARDLQNVMLQLEQLRRMGVSIAIDDFGTGYSSLAYLRSLPINKVKIDKSFIKGIPGDREGTALVAEIVRLAHILSLEVVAEGVETLAQAAFLREAGCEAMQGYLFARPLPGPDCATLLRAGKRLIIHAG